MKEIKGWCLHEVYIKDSLSETQKEPHRHHRKNLTTLRLAVLRRLSRGSSQDDCSIAVKGRWDYPCLHYNSSFLYSFRQSIGKCSFGGQHVCTCRGQNSKFHLNFYVSLVIFPVIPLLLQLPPSPPWSPVPDSLKSPLSPTAMFMLVYMYAQVSPNKTHKSCSNITPSFNPVFVLWSLIWMINFTWLKIIRETAL